MDNKLTVLVITYNHIKYIRKCLDSILSQKTKFAFNIHILDDASTDGSSEVIKEYAKKYPDKITPFIRKHNLGVVENIYQGIKGVETKYFATIEADDYWCDDNKLQKQIDILDSNLDCSFCAHNTVIQDKNEKQTKLFTKNNYNIFKKYSMPTEFKEKNFVKVHPSSRVYRTSCIDWKNLIHKDIIVWDSCSYWYFLSKGKLYYIDEVMSVYNYSGEGVFSGSSDIKKMQMSLRNIFKTNDQFNYKYNKIFNKLILKHNYYLRLTCLQKFLLKITPKLYKGKEELFCKRVEKNFNKKKKHSIFVKLLKRIKNINTLKLLYLDYKNNFGDILSLKVLQYYYTKKPIVKCQDSRKCDVVFIGSHMEQFLKNKDQKIKRKNYKKTLRIIGSGFIAPENYCKEKEERFIRKVRVLGARGKITQARLEKILKKDLSHITLGDPGLLASKIFDTSKIKKKYKVGIIPHYVDEGNEALNNIKIKDVLIIDIKDNTKNVMEKIASCDFILSSAMHGLIAADSLNIPNRRIVLSEKIVGGDYKYNDYYSIYKKKNAPPIDLRKNTISTSDIRRLKEEYHVSKSEVEKVKSNLIKLFESI